MIKIPGNFVHERGVHSDTAALRDLFASAGHRYPEPFFFGIGEGLGFYYRNGRSLSHPLIGGRIGNLELDQRVCRAMGAPLGINTSTSPRRAQAAMMSLIEAGKPVMLHVDPFYLKFLRADYHFGAHCVVVAGADEKLGMAYVAERSADDLVEVPLIEIAEARASMHRPFPPHNRWFEIDVPEEISIDARAIMGAIGRNATEMLNSTTRSVGIGGIYYFATCVRSWNSAYGPKELGSICTEAYNAIDGDGTGGGCFRHLYADFLQYASDVAGIESLKDTADEYRRVGRLWSQVAKMFKEAECGCTSLSEISDVLQKIASREHELQVSLLTAANLCCRRK